MSSLWDFPLMEAAQKVKEIMKDPGFIARWEKGRAEREAYRMPGAQPAAPAKEPEEQEKSGPNKP